ncbi:MAG: hypothetical protein ACXVCS_03480 [Bdellovibrionota bacterium]
MKFLCSLAVLASLSFPAFAADSEGDDVPAPAGVAVNPLTSTPVLKTPEEHPLWYRNAGEFLASRTTRSLAPTDVSTKIITDAKRFDVSVGKRIPLKNWNTEGPTDTWSFGMDGGMLASLIRYTNQGRLTFATNTFDGMFGLYAGFIESDGWMVIFRTAHLSAHLVDNSPMFLTPISYSQFWNEIIVGKSFPDLRQESDWDLHLQGSVGLNNTSTPLTDQPRVALDADFGYALNGPDSLAVIANADALRAGVQNQAVTYEFFLGLGHIARPQTRHRPFRMGVAHFRGSDYRNQLFFERQNWTTFELAAEF